MKLPVKVVKSNKTDSNIDLFANYDLLLIIIAILFITIYVMHLFIDGVERYRMVYEWLILVQQNGS